MAAAEYFSSAPMTSSSNLHTSSPYVPQQNYTPQQNYSNQQHYSPQQPSSPYVQPGLAPPPYHDQKPGVHFAPTPIEAHQRHSFSGQQRPQFSVTPPQNNHQVHTPSNLAVQQRPNYNAASHNGNSPPRPQYLTPHMRPYANPNSSQYSLDQGYSSDPESHRRRHRQNRRRESGESRSVKSGSKSSSRSRNADGFIGAAGGGLIGDLIFPGLGTIGGAALGWIGGRDYGKHRKDREEKRYVEQAEWEQKFRPHGRSSSHGHRSSRGSSEEIGEYEPRDSRGRQSGYR